MSAAADWLLVPMEVSALVAGRDAERHRWTDLSPDFSRIRGGPCLTGPELVRPLDEAHAAPGPGIHLHWFLPEAYGREDGGAHPPIPNRWLIRRVRHRPGSAEFEDCSAWVLESDHLHGSTAPSGEPGSTRLPHFHRPELFDSVGRVTPLQQWAEPPPPRRPLRLTALGPGTPEFAASYPACRSVLGFHDADPADGAAGRFEIGYLVIGWCADPADDLLRPDGGERARRLADWQWITGDPAAAGCSRVLCHGAVARIGWDRDEPHRPAVPRAGLRVFVADSAAEALAALASRSASGTAQPADALEPLLTAFQHDLLGRGHALDEIAAELHRHRFGSVPGGDRYTLDARPAAHPSPHDATPPETPAAELPAELEDLLFELNAQAREDARLQRELASRRQQLFAGWSAWSRACARRQADPAAAPAGLRAGAEAVVACAAAAEQAQRGHVEARTRLERALAGRWPDLALTRGTQAPFHRPSDPAVLLAGPGLAPSGLHDSHGSQALACRSASEVVGALEARVANQDQTVGVAASALFPLPAAWPPAWPPAGPPPELADALLHEMLLLEPARPGTAASARATAGRVVERLEAAAGLRLSATERQRLQETVARTIDGAAPSGDVALRSAGAARRPDARALLRWQRNPWRPLLLAWEIEWFPERGLGGDGELATSWTPWPLAEDGNGFEWPEDAGACAAAPQTYRGCSLLAPQAAWVLQRRLAALLGADRDAKAAERVERALSTLGGRALLAQSLGGFHDALLQLRPGLQLPPWRPADVLGERTRTPRPDPLAGRVAGVELLDPQHMHACDPDADFLPIRAGELRFTRLWVVDSFGQTLEAIGPLDGGAPSATVDVVASSALRRRGTDRIALPPRYAQPARLDLCWVSADPARPGGSPLCGWLFANHLDRSLMVCDAEGSLRGALQKKRRAAPAGGGGGPPSAAKAFAWVPLPGTANRPAALGDRHLRALVLELLELGADAGDALFEAVVLAQGDASAPEADARLSILVGRPLALARASLGLELAGLPAQRTAAGGGHAGADATRGFTRVRFPVVLGGQPSGDGLVGLVVDGGGLRLRQDAGRARDGRPDAVVVDAERTVPLTLLLDPTQPVHARCGLLPRQSLQLPARVVAGLSSIRDVFFQAAPLLGPAGAPRVPHPSDDYGHWSWATRPRVTVWREYPDVADPAEHGGFAPGPLELHEGWLKLAMNPVEVAAFWIKEGAVTVPAGARVTLGWKLRGASVLSLSADAGEPPLASWRQTLEAPLPQDFTLTVTRRTRVTLEARDDHGHRATRSLQLDVAGPRPDDTGGPHA